MEPQNDNLPVHTAPPRGGYFMDVTPTPSVLEQNPELDQLSNATTVKDQTLRKFARNNIAIVGIGLALLLPLSAWGYLHFSRPVVQVTTQPNSTNLSVSKGDYYSVGIHGDLQVTRDTTLQGLVSTEKDLNVGGNQTIAGNLVVTGTVTAANIKGNLAVGTGTGQNGAQGPKGDKGDRGSVGQAGSNGTNGTNGLDGSPTCPNGGCVSLQSGSPGTQETGNINITGDITAGGQVQAAALNVSGNTILTGTVTVGNLLPVNAAQTVQGMIRQTISTGQYDGYINGVNMLKGLDGFARIGFYDYADAQIKFVRCTDLDCTSPITAIVSDPRQVYPGPTSVSMALGPDGFARFSYTDNTNGNLRLARCSDIDCTSPIITTVDATNNYPGYAGNKIIMGSDGFPRIAAVDNNTYMLRLYRCTDADCTSPVVSQIEDNSYNYGNVGMALGQDGFPRITYYNVTLDALRLARCTNANCTSPVLTTIDSNSASGQYGNVPIFAPDGKLRVGYIGYDGTNYPMKFAVCNDADCTSPTITAIAGTNDEGYTMGMTLDGTGLAHMTMENSMPSGTVPVVLVTCQNSDCSSSSVIQVETGDINANYYPGYSGSALFIAQNGFPGVVYDTYGEGGIHFVQLHTANGQDASVAGTDIGSTSNYFGQIYAQGEKLQDASSSSVLTVNQQGSGLVADFQSNGTSVASVNSQGLNIAGTLTVQGAATFNQSITFSNDVTVGGSLSASQPKLATPITVANVGAAGATNYAYQVVGFDSAGNAVSKPYGIGYTDTGNATLSSTNYNHLTWSAVSGASIYKIYHIYSLGVTTGLIGTTSSLSFDDTGIVPSGTVPGNEAGSANISAGQQIIFSGNYAYMADPTNGVKIVDISNPIHPTLASSISYSNVSRLFISGKYLYAAAELSQNFKVFDISSPQNPTLVSTTSTISGLAGRPTDIYVQGSYAYIPITRSAGNSGIGWFAIYDISSPSSPKLVSYNTVLNYAGKVVVSGRYAYLDVQANPQTLLIYDVSDPANIKLVGSNGNATTYSTSSNLELNGNKLLSSSGEQVIEFDVSDPGNPTVSTTVSSAFIVNASARSNYVYFVRNDSNPGGADGLFTYDISDTSNIRLVSAFATPRGSSAFAINGHFAYVSNSSGILNVYDLGGVDTSILQAKVVQAGSLNISQDVGVGGNLTVAGDTSLGGNTTVSGDLTVDGQQVFLGTNSNLGPWQTNANSLPTNIQNAGSIVANGYIYAISNDNACSPAGSAVYYAKLNANGTTGTWQTEASSLPEGRAGPGVTSANGYAYVIAGQASCGQFRNTVYYAKLNADGTTGSWKTSPNTLPASPTGPGAVTANGYVYVVGGGTSAVYYAKLNADGTTGIWQTSANALPDTLINHVTTVANGYLYAIGGQGGAGVVDTVYYAKLNADGTLGSWQSNTNHLPEVRRKATGFVLNGYTYVVGGENGFTAPNTVFFAKLNADGSTGTWQSSGNVLSSNRNLAAATTANGYAYILGGENSGSTATVYFASVSRVNIAGSLDLVGLTGQNLADAGGTGGSVTAANGNFVGTLQVQGGANFADSLSVDKNLHIGGQALFQDAGDSINAFQIQDSTGTTLFGIDASSKKIITNQADGASAIGFTFDTSITYATTGAKLLSVQNNGVEKFAIDKNGHVITGGTAPTATVNGNAGTTATCTVDGNDTAGTITLSSAGTGQAAGLQCTINFAGNFAAAPRTVLSPTGANGAALQPYTTSSVSGITLDLGLAPIAGQVYIFNYFSPQ